MSSLQRRSAASFHQVFSAFLRLQQLAGMNALENLYDYCSANGVSLIFSHVNEQPMKTMRRAGFVDLVGEEHFRSCIDDAIAHARELLEAEEGAENLMKTRG